MGSVKKTETGSVLSFNTYLPKNLDETKISFTPHQEGQGTPSPENIREIAGKSSITLYQQGDDGVTHETSVSFPAVGKNLFDGEWRKGRYVDGIWANTNTWRTSELIPVEQNTTYCVSVDEPRTIGRIYCNLFDRNGNWIGSDYGTSVTTTADTVLMAICNTKNVVSAWTDIQLEKGSTATAYEPFNNTVYGGYVDLVNGGVVAEWTKVDMGDLNWSLYEKCWVCIPSDIKIHSRASSQVADLVCDIYEQGRVTTASQFRDTPEGQLVARNDYKNIGIKDSTYTTAKDFKTAVTGHYLAYKLAEPIHYPLSPRILTTLQGVNTMWSDGDSLTISYTDDVVNTYDFRRHISLDTPHKASASGAVASFGTDMVGKMKCKIHFSPEQEGSGTPSPDNVRNISGRSSVKLWQSGKNLFDKASAKMGRYESVDGVWTLVENAAWYASDLIRVKPNTRYSMFGGTPLASVGAYINVYDEDMTRVNYTTHLSYIDTTANAKYLSVHSTGTGSFYKNRDTIMICEGSDVPSEYEPYTGNEITFTFPSTVGDNGVVYGGYLDAENGEVVAEYQKMVITGDENWQLNAWSHNGVFLVNRETSYDTAKIPFMIGQSYSNMLSYNTEGYYLKTDNTFSIVGAGTLPNFTYMTLYNSAWGTTAEEYKVKLKELYEAGTPLTIVAPLKTAYIQHYSLTPQSIATLRGSNRIWSDGDSVEVEYYKHTDEAQEYIPAEVLGTGNIAIVTSDGYLIGEEQDFIKY